MNLRQHIARAAGVAFFMPVAIPVMLLTPSPHPEWLYSYGRVLEKIAGPAGFTWSGK